MGNASGTVIGVPRSISWLPQPRQNLRSGRFDGPGQLFTRGFPRLLAEVVAVRRDHAVEGPAEPADSIKWWVRKRLVHVDDLVRVVASPAQIVRDDLSSEGRDRSN